MTDSSTLSAACVALPLFPLPGGVLLPGPALPLHVFEPRYRQLVQDVLSVAGRTGGAEYGFLAIPQMVPDEESGLTPPILPYAGVGKILAHRLLDDGRYNILVQPVGRVRLVEELLGRAEPYRMARVDLLADDPFVPRELERAGARLLALVGPLLGRMGDRAQELRQGLSTLDRAKVAEAVAPFVLRDADDRQAYLAEDDPVARAGLVETAVLGIMGALGEGLGDA